MAESHAFNEWGSTCEEIINSQFPMHRACRDGDIDALSSLLFEAQHGVYAEDCFYGWTPAHWAAYFGKLACLRKLMQVSRIGADCDIKSSRFCQTPAHLAAYGDHPLCLQWLIQSGASIEAQDYLGETPVHKAARTGSIECSNLLISHGARLFIRNNNNMTAAELASKQGFVNCARLMSAAEQQQDSLPRGVYSEQPKNGIAVPTPFDITSGAATILPKENGIHLTNGSNDTNGHSNAISDDCAMEMEESSQETLSYTNTALSDKHSQSFTANGHQGDITLNPAISTNQLPVAGRKRCREEVDVSDFKRQRTTGIVWNGCGQNEAFHNRVPNLCEETYTNSTSIPTEKVHTLSCHDNSVSQQAKQHANCIVNGHHQKALLLSDHLEKLSSTADEHISSILLEQGYASMCYDALCLDDVTRKFF